jgi:hypothetical protein
MPKKILGADWEDLLELLISFQLIYREETGGAFAYIALAIPVVTTASR